MWLYRIFLKHFFLSRFFSHSLYDKKYKNLTADEAKISLPVYSRILLVAADLKI